MKVAVIMHVASEGPGSLGEFLESKGASLQYARLFDGEKLPRNAQDYQAIVSMGGPMNVYEDDKYPFLADETVFLREAIDAKIPVLGVCLGAQMIAKACNAAVKKAPVEEIGWSEVELTDDGRRDGLFWELKNSLPVFQWHGDTFDIPAGGKLLATSKVCPHQAFRIKNAYGLQFHVEITPNMLSDWFADSKNKNAILSKYKEMEHILKTNAQRIYTNFIALAE